MEQPTRFIGMDVHKDAIVVAVTTTGEIGNATPYGTVPNTAATLEKLVKRLRHVGNSLRIVHAEIGTFWEILAQQPVSVLVGATLPRAVGIAEVDLDARVDF